EHRPVNALDRPAAALQLQQVRRLLEGVVVGVGELRVAFAVAVDRRPPHGGGPAGEGHVARPGEGPQGGRPPPPRALARLLPLPPRPTQRRPPPWSSYPPRPLEWGTDGVPSGRPSACVESGRLRPIV